MLEKALIMLVSEQLYADYISNTSADTSQSMVGS